MPRPAFPPAPLAALLCLFIAVTAPAKACSAAPAGGQASPRDFFRHEGALPDRALLTAPGPPSAAPSAHSTPARSTPPKPMPDPRLDAPMLLRLAGVRAVLDRPALVRLAAAARVPPGPADGTAGPAAPGEALASPVAVLTLVWKDGNSARAEVRPLDDRLFLLRRLDTGQAATLPRDRLDLDAPGWDDAIDAAPIQPGRVLDLPPPLIASDEQLTGPVVRRRLAMRDTRLPATGPTRDLDHEAMWARLPSGHDPARPAGLLVWISPSPAWRLPEHFGPVLDELGIIAIGADNAGNDRPIIDRLQLVLDAVATAQRRWLIDDRRVYLTGFSGGARCSSILLYAYPERFAGAIPIVGLNSWHRLPLPDGKALPAAAPMPSGEAAALARSRRVFAISGTEDFNLPEMRSRIELLDAFGCPARLEVVDGMKHEQMPPPGLITTALRWIDEPRRQALADESAAGAEALAAHDARSAGADAEADEVASLNSIARDFPWTPAAFEAAARLGLTPPPTRPLP